MDKDTQSIACEPKDDNFVPVTSCDKSSQASEYDARVESLEKIKDVDGDKQGPDESESLNKSSVVEMKKTPIVLSKRVWYIDSDRFYGSFSTQTKLGQSSFLGYFSCHLEPDGKTMSYHADRSSLRYLTNRSGDVDLDLTEGYSADKKYGRVPTEELYILRWIKDNMNDLVGDNNQTIADFICHNRLLRSIMFTPYTKNDDWLCVAIKVRGSIILKEFDSEERRELVADYHEDRSKSAYAGYKFIEKITRRADGAPSQTGFEGNRDSFYIVTQSNVGDHKLLYSSRTDCVLSEGDLEKPINEMQFALIKTRGHNWDEHHITRKRFWRNRACNWWIESAVSNINVIVCGDKTIDLRIKSLTQFTSHQLPKAKHGWSPKVCTDFLDSVLTSIKTEVIEELTPYTFHYFPESQRRIEIKKLDQNITEYLPSWFVDYQP